LSYGFDHHGFIHELQLFEALLVLAKHPRQLGQNSLIGRLGRSP
jgi:hypothetical protein